MSGEDDFFGDGTSADEAPPNNRHGARQVALQALYWEQSAATDSLGALDQLCARFGLAQEVQFFAAEILQHAGEHADELDALAAAQVQHWRWERIARIDRLILRLALAEILFIEEVPVRVSIFEAVELAKSYSTDKSYAFVNGVLDGIVREKGLSV